MKYPVNKQVAVIWLLFAVSEGFISTQLPWQRDDASFTRLFLNKDQKIVFGSDDSSIEAGGIGSDEDEEYAKKQRERQAVIDNVLEAQDLEFKEARRRKKWGDFADAKTKEDIMKVEQSIKTRIALENKQKSEQARLQGINLEILEAQDTVSEENGNLKIRAGSGSELWYNKMDEDLQEEWDALERGNDDIVAADGQQESTDTVQVNGKIISKDALQGVRVGSAGGWSLEVFPGDFVVHRKYGIGRFERTCLRK